MASARYTLNIKPEDLKPEEEVPLTPAQKLANWWDYHWKLVVVLVLLAGLVIVAAREILSQVKPDYRVGIVTRMPVPEETVEQLQTALAAFGQDLNGDGDTVVFVDTYTMDTRPPEVVEAERLAAENNPETGGQDMMANMETVASQTRLLADLETCETMFFLTDNVEGLQTVTGTLGRLDGSPVADRYSVQGVEALPYSACPVLMALPLGEYADIMGNHPHPSIDVLKNLSLVRRSFPQGQGMAQYPAETEAFFNALIEGAPRP